MLEEIIYNLCIEANTKLPDGVVEKIINAYESETNDEAKQALGLILENAKMAQENKTPLCQDTGQVIVFVKGRCFPENFEKSINDGVSKAYKENFYRKSVVKNAVFNRENTQTNTPCIIYTEIGDNEELEIELLIKGGGSENVSQVKMLSPTASEDEIIEYVKSVAQQAGSKGCPPYFIGIGIGGTIDYASILSKKALLLEENIDENHKNLAEKIKNAVNDLNIGPAGLGGPHTALDVKILTSSTHIACMPVAVTISCHSLRHAKRGKEAKQAEALRLRSLEAWQNKSQTSKPLNLQTSQIDKLKSLKLGQNILLSGEIYTARDMAHKRLVEMIEKGEELPFDLKDKIIFYAGPCPCSQGCVVGAIGPTTASRMDKFAPILYQNGVLATIGKGERSEEVKKAIKQVGGLYFTAIGGISSYLSRRFIRKDLVCFEDLGTEAVYRFEVEDLPLRLDIV